VNKVHFSSERPDWATPVALFQRIEEHFDLKFDVDVCATRENRKCASYFGPDHDILPDYRDGRAYPWFPGKNHFMNPPYGREIGKWVKKAADESEHCLVVGLLPARTDTAWWHDHIMGRAASVDLIRGRIVFEGATFGAPFPSALVLWVPGGGPPAYFGAFNTRTS